MRKPKKSAKLWLARDETGVLYLYNGKPEKSKFIVGIWNSKTAGAVRINSELFPDVKWEDEEPTQVTLRI